MDMKTHRMVCYFLQFAQAVRQLFGKEGLDQAVHQMAEMSAQEKVKYLKSFKADVRHSALADRFANMLAEMGGTSHQTTKNRDYATVHNPSCPCPYPKLAEKNGFTPEEITRLSCRLCLNGYTKAAEALGMTTKTELFRGGCSVAFLRQK